MDRQVAAQFRNEIVAAAGAVGIDLTYNRLRQLVVRAIREGHARNAIRQLQLEARYPRTASTLARGIGIGRPVRDPVEPKRLDFGDMKDTAMGDIVYDPNSGAYNQRKRAYDTAGIPRTKAERKLAILGAHIQPFIDRYQGLNPPIWDPAGTTVSPGKFPLSFGTYGTDGYYQMPLYLMDLTCAYQNRAEDIGTGVSALYRGVPMMRLRKDATTPYRYWFGSVAGEQGDSAGTADSRWICERTPIVAPSDPDTDFRTGDKGYISWVDIRMNVYGAVNAPSTVMVQLIQFEDEDMTPPVFAKAGAVGTTDSTLELCPQDTATTDRSLFDRWQDFWQSDTDRLVGNPIAKRGSTKVSGVYRVLYTKRFEMEPTMTTENDKTPHCIEFNLKYHMDKVIDYVRNPDGNIDVATADLDEGNTFGVEDYNKTSVACAGRGRVYLRITGVTLKDTSANPASNTIGAYSPSFDLIVRRKHAFLARSA